MLYATAIFNRITIFAWLNVFWHQTIKSNQNHNINSLGLNKIIKIEIFAAPVESCFSRKYISEPG